MKTIWKYALNVAGEQWVKVPVGAKVISVGVQNESPVIWVEVEPSDTLVSIHIITLGTGEPVKRLGRFVGTYQLDGGNFVGHVYID